MVFSYEIYEKQKKRWLSLGRVCVYAFVCVYACAYLCVRVPGWALGERLGERGGIQVAVET